LVVAGLLATTAAAAEEAVVEDLAAKETHPRTSVVEKAVVAYLAESE